MKRWMSNITQWQLMIVFYLNLKFSGLTYSHLPYHFHLPCSWMFRMFILWPLKSFVLEALNYDEEVVNTAGPKGSEPYFLDWKEVTQWVKYLPAMQETQEMWVRSLGQKDTLEEEMVTHSTLLPWRIPWTGEPDRLQSTGLQRLGHKWSYRARPRTIWSCTLAYCCWEFCCNETGNC